MLSQKHIKSGKVLDDLFPCDCPPLRGQKIFRVLNAQKADFLDFCTIPRTGNLGGRAAADRVKYAVTASILTLKHGANHSLRQW